MSNWGARVARVEHHDQKTFGEHLGELKKRSLIVLGNFLLGALIGFALHKQIEAILQKPLGQTLYYSNPAGGLSFALQIAMGVGIIAALPLLLYQIMQFIRPAMKPIKTRLVLLVIMCSIGLAVMAVVYVYFVSMPAALNFLVSFNGDSIQALIDVNDYIRFVLAYCGAAILAFQLPLFLLFANKVRRFPPGGLTKLQRPVIIGAIIVAGVITPTVDPINQMLLAVPIIILFESGAIVVSIANRRYRKRQANTPVFTIAKPLPNTVQTTPVTNATTRTAPAQQAMRSMDGFVVAPHKQSKQPEPAQAVAATQLNITDEKRPSKSSLIMDVVRPPLQNLG